MVLQVVATCKAETGRILATCLVMQDEYHALSIAEQNSFVIINPLLNKGNGMRRWMSKLLPWLMVQSLITLLLLAGLNNPVDAYALARNMALGLFALGGLICVITESDRTPGTLSGRGGVPGLGVLQRLQVSCNVQTALRLMAAALLWLMTLRALHMGG